MSNSNFSLLIGQIEKCQNHFSEILQTIEKNGGIQEDQYVRYLSMQYHLTKGVQRPFFLLAAHPDIAHRNVLRKFLIGFAQEEEFHFEIAARDLKAMGREPLPITLDVELWWAYFNTIVDSKPFMRLGATCILENIAGRSRPIIGKLFSEAKYLTKKNSVFFTIHQHDESLPHGDQILEVLSKSHLEESHLIDLLEGARRGAIMYLRCINWAFTGNEVSERITFESDKRAA